MRAPIERSCGNVVHAPDVMVWAEDLVDQWCIDMAREKKSSALQRDFLDRESGFTNSGSDFMNSERGFPKWEKDFPDSESRFLNSASGFMNSGTDFPSSGGGFSN
jgi:hypothetical protein